MKLQIFSIAMGVLGVITWAAFGWSLWRRRAVARQRPEPGVWTITTCDCAPGELSAMVYERTGADYIRVSQLDEFTFQVEAHWNNRPQMKLAE